MQSADDVLTLKSGQRLACPACDTELIVTRPPSRGVRLTCGGLAVAAMSAERAERAKGGDHLDEGGTPVQLGKRYVDDSSGLEVLCTKPGEGALSCEGQSLGSKSAKPLPASD
jgi:hypothetical protein